jgi:hypothetical protein
MTNVFVYEFVTGGGLLGRADDNALRTMAAEGAAMVRSLVADFACLPQVRPSWLCDGRLPLDLPGQGRLVHSASEHSVAFDELAAAADWTVVIAPELGGHLVERCRAVLAAGGRLLGPGLEFVSLASDKHATAETLRAAGVPAPRGVSLSAAAPLPADFGYPAVWKPRDGAGSTDVRLVRSGCSGPAASALGLEQPNASGRLETFCPGLAVSVAFLTGPNGAWPMPACEQRLTADGRFSYLGGRLPLERSLAERAVALGQRALAALPPSLGYVGLDLVLGDAGDGSRDFVIEVNPRLTTSYVGLRAAAKVNLAAALLAVAEGTVPQLRFSPRALEFDAQGTVAFVAAENGDGR